jgi:hypothetical protein
MTGFTYMDTVTGKVTYYTSSGGEFNSRGAEDAVASNPIVRQGKLQPTQPLLYNAYQQNTWVVPLVAPDTGKYQTLALVQAKNGHVVIGSTSSATPQTDAFERYAALLGVGAPLAENVSAERPLQGAIDRISPASNGAIFFTLQGKRQIFSVDASDPAALLARSGDRVQFRAAAPPSGAVAIARGFRDSQLPR